MDTKVDTIIKCSDCGTALPDEWISSKKKNNCSQCGSSAKTINLNIVENVGIEIHDCLEGKVKNINYNSKRNPRYEFIEGDDVRKSDGKWMKKTRIIDKNNNKYLEIITDPETNEVIHSCEEPLSEHFNHGHAKFKKDENA